MNPASTRDTLRDRVRQKCDSDKRLKRTFSFEHDRPGSCFKTKAAPEGAGNLFDLTPGLRARVQHGNGAAILRPAGDVVADRDWPLLAVGDGAHPTLIDAVRAHI